MTALNIILGGTAAVAITLAIGLGVGYGVDWDKTDETTTQPQTTTSKPLIPDDYWPEAEYPNGLAKTPPMGFMTWQRFRCVTDCEQFPDTCISDKVIRSIADGMVSNGWLEAGYEYIIIDDCWSDKSGRDENGSLVPNPERFPNGMKTVADYVHSKGLKFGIYADLGEKTCGGYPGSLGFHKQDVALFDSWGTDYLKLDGCAYEYTNETQLKQIEGYMLFSKELLEAESDIVYSCSYPAIWEPWEGEHPGHNPNVDYAWLTKYCNLWRNWDDIDDSFSSIQHILGWFGRNQDFIQPFAGPGHWNDPDMLVGGNFGLTPDQVKVQMSVWAIFSAPFLLGNDPRNVAPEIIEIMQNEDIIRINQDVNGVQGRLVQCNDLNCNSDVDCSCEKQVWMKPLADGSYALTAVNFYPYGQPFQYYFNIFWELEEKDQRAKNTTWQFTEIFSQKNFDKSTVGEHDLDFSSFSHDLKKTLYVYIPPNSCFTWILTPYKEPVPVPETYNNGALLTPPMGMMTWQRFRCITDCEQFPDDCISEKLLKSLADELSKDEWQTAGYEYLMLDDCWTVKGSMKTGRDPKTGILLSDPIRFPNGMKHVIDYVHSKGLKFGIYGDYGTYTCGGYPGSTGFEKIDSQTWADWGVDYLKLDGCYSNEHQQTYGYERFSKELVKSGRQIAYSCSYPAYWENDNNSHDSDSNVHVDYRWLAKYCNLWRNWDDIDDSMSSVEGIINWFADSQDRIQPFAGPGHWNDPDMLVIGNFGLSTSQSKIQMAVWAQLAAPLLLGNDPRNLAQEFRDILQHEKLIEISQDPLGIQGLRVQCDNTNCPKKSSSCACKMQTWLRPLESGKYAVTVISFLPYGQPFQYVFNIADYLREEDQNDISTTVWAFEEVDGQIGQVNPPRYNVTATDDHINVSKNLVAYIPPNHSFTWIISRENGASLSTPREALIAEEEYKNLEYTTQKIRVELRTNLEEHDQTHASRKTWKQRNSHLLPVPLHDERPALSRSSKIHLEL